MKAKSMLKKLNGYIQDEFKGNPEAGLYYGVSASYMSLVRNGRRSPTDLMLDNIGLYCITEKTTIKTYHKIKD